MHLPENPILATMKSWVGTHAADAVGMPSAVGKWLNGLLVKVEQGNVAFEYVVRPEMGNPVGLLHGGILSCMFDDCMGATIISYTSDKFYSTINLTVDYLASAKVGDTIRVEAKVIRAGRNVAYLHATAHNAEGKQLAHATTNLLATQPLNQ